MKEISLRIDGKNITCLTGTSILNAALQNGFKIPTLCHHPHLKPAGACRICLVEEVTTGRIMASCVTPVSPNMEISTDSEEIRKHRTNVVNLMMANHPESCIVCNQGNRCELRKVAAELGLGKIDLYPMPHYTGFEEANPFIIRDLSKCILCGKCIRADHELVVVGAIDYNLRGFKSRPATLQELPLEKSSCTFCGTCVSLCPTGALVAKNKRYVGTAQRETTSTCGFCGVGCSLVIGAVGDTVVEVNPSHEEGAVNRSTLCVRGHFAHDFLNAPERLTEPMIRKDGEMTRVSWDEALTYVAENLGIIKKENGPQSLAFMGSSKCSIEENYLFQKIARMAFGTNNVDNGSYGGGRPVLHTFAERLDRGGRINPLSDLEDAELICVLGANPVHSAPVVGYGIKRAARTMNMPVILVDPRRTALTPFSSLWLPVAPQTDADLLNGLAAMLYQRQSYDRDFIGRFTEGFELFCVGLSAIDLDKICRVTGIKRELIEKTVDLMEDKKIAFVVGHGILQQKNGPSALDALLNLALMTGSLGHRSTGLFFVSHENNQAGAWDMGAVHDYLPGRLSIQDDGNRKAWERSWGVKISPDPGLNMVRMIEEAEKGNLKALFIMGENPVRSLPQPDRVRKALENLKMLVVQDILTSETAHLADVVLPGAAFSEKEGAFTNIEGRIQSFKPVVPPPGEAKSDWQILEALLTKSGRTEPYGSIEKIREEIKGLVPGYSHWSLKDETSWLKEESSRSLFGANGNGNAIPFRPVGFNEEIETDETYPFTAILGSLRYHLGSGTRTSLSSRIKDFELRGDLCMCPQDGEKLDLGNGEMVRISSRFGSISRKVTLSNEVRQGQVFVPIAFNDNDAMGLIPLTQLGAPEAQGWKSCSVRIEKM